MILFGLNRVYPKSKGKFPQTLTANYAGTEKHTILPSIVDK